MGFSGQSMPNMENLGRKETHSPAGDHAGKDGEVVLTKPVLEGALILQPLKNMCMSIKKEADRCLGWLEMGSVLNGAGEI
jgi:hypothetical protein